MENSTNENEAKQSPLAIPGAIVLAGVGIVAIDMGLKMCYGKKIC